MQVIARSSKYGFLSMTEIHLRLLLSIEKLQHMFKHPYSLWERTAHWLARLME